MLISIIIPTRNRFEYVKLLIADILKQDVSNYEIIVVDQSDDPQKTEHCNHIITDTLGPCVSRNIGVQSANGEVLVFLDDDAHIYADFIREITTPILEGRFDAVAGAVCDPEGNYLRKSEDYLNAGGTNFIKILTRNPDSPVSRISIAFPGCCAAISKKVFNAVGGFDESFDPTGAGEDRDMALKLFKNGYALWYNAEAKLLHVVAPTGGSRDVGSRSMMLDVHTYKMCKTHFSDIIAESLKTTILNSYSVQFRNSILKLKNIRTKYRSLQKIKNLLKD